MWDEIIVVLFVGAASGCWGRWVGWDDWDVEGWDCGTNGLEELWPSEELVVLLLLSGSGWSMVSLEASLGVLFSSFGNCQLCGRMNFNYEVGGWMECFMGRTHEEEGLNCSSQTGSMRW